MFGGGLGDGRSSAAVSPSAAQLACRSGLVLAVGRNLVGRNLVGSVGVGVGPCLGGPVQLSVLGVCFDGPGVGVLVVVGFDSGSLGRRLRGSVGGSFRSGDGRTER